MMKTRRMKWAGHAYRILVVKPEGKRPEGICKYKCDDDIKMDRRDI
jgi:hypothetical protein